MTFFVLIPVIHSRRRRRQTSRVQSHAQERVLRVVRGTFRLVIGIFACDYKDYEHELKHIVTSAVNMSYIPPTSSR